MKLLIYGLFNYIIQLYKTLNIRSSEKNYLHRHKNTQNNTLRLGSELLPSSSENTKILKASDITHVQASSQIRIFYLPTDAQENCFKNNIKIYIKKTPTCFGLTFWHRSFTFKF
jgi:hypothetical protein